MADSMNISVAGLNSFTMVPVLGGGVNIRSSADTTDDSNIIGQATTGITADGSGIATSDGYIYIEVFAPALNGNTGLIRHDVIAPQNMALTDYINMLNAAMQQAYGINVQPMQLQTQAPAPAPAPAQNNTPASAPAPAQTPAPAPAPATNTTANNVGSNLTAQLTGAWQWIQKNPVPSIGIGLALAYLFNGGGGGKKKK
jgi:hypothetical protein